MKAIQTKIIVVTVEIVVVEIAVIRTINPFATNTILDVYYNS